MADKNYTDFYIKHYDQGGKGAAGTGEHVIKGSLWKRAGYKPGMSVLDYGCGWGAMVPEIHDPELYLGVDIVPKAIELAKQEFPGVRFQHFVSGELRKVGNFDLVVAMSVFTHIPYADVPAALSDIHQNMNDSGFGIIDILDGNKNPHHRYIHFWPLPEFETVLQEAGFSSLFLETIIWPGYTHTYLKIEKL